MNGDRKLVKSKSEAVMRLLRLSWEWPKNPRDSMMILSAFLFLLTMEEVIGFSEHHEILLLALLIVILIQSYIIYRLIEVCILYWATRFHLLRNMCSPEMDRAEAKIDASLEDCGLGYTKQPLITRPSVERWFLRITKGNYIVYKLPDLEATLVLGKEMNLVVKGWLIVAFLGPVSDENAEGIVQLAEAMDVHLRRSVRP